MLAEEDQTILFPDLFITRRTYIPDFVASDLPHLYLFGVVREVPLDKLVPVPEDTLLVDVAALGVGEATADVLVLDVAVVFLSEFLGGIDKAEE